MAAGRDEKWNATAALARLLDGSVSAAASLLDTTDRAAKGATASAGTLAAFLSQPELLRWSRELTAGASTAYDRALDARFLRSHLGGGEHRLFDGSHDLFGSWEAARGALSDDSLGSELAGWLLALWRDGTTPNGLPFLSVSKDSFDAWATWVHQAAPLIDRQWLYDLASWDAFELLAAGLGLGAVLFGLSHGDQVLLAESLGSLGIASVLTANPLLGLGVVASAAWLWRTKRPLPPGDLLRGGALAGISVALFGALGLPVLVEFVIVLAVVRILRKSLRDPADLLGVLRAASIRARSWTEEAARQYRDAIGSKPNSGLAVATHGGL